MNIQLLISLVTNVLSVLRVCIITPSEQSSNLRKQIIAAVSALVWKHMFKVF